MKKLCFLQVVLISLLFSIISYAQMDSPQKHYAYAVDLMENRVFDDAKREFIKIIHIYAENEYKDDARYYLGEIAFKEGQLEVALRQWERLKKEYPQSPYIADIARKIALVSELLAKEEKARIEDMSVKALFDNAEFLLKEHRPILTIDTSFLGSELLALEWYKKIVEKYPNSQYAPKALYSQILIYYGWSRHKPGEGFGLVYDLYAVEAFNSVRETTSIIMDPATVLATPLTQITQARERLQEFVKKCEMSLMARYGKLDKPLETMLEMSIEFDFDAMTSLLKELEEKYPNSHWIEPANFIIGQAYWNISTNEKYDQKISATAKAIEHFQNVINLTKDNEFSLHRQIAQARIKELQINRARIKESTKKSEGEKNKTTPRREEIEQIRNKLLNRQRNRK